MSPKTVLITGASSGFGWAMTDLFLKNGWTVHATSRQGELEHAASLSPALRSKLHIHKLDLLQPDSRNEFVCAMINSLSGLDVLINNAGFGLFGATEDLSESQIRRQMEVNFFGTVFVTQGLLPLVRKAQGHIINLSSVLGFSGLPLMSMYCASKFAVEGWSEALKYEVAALGVQVSVVQPGAHRTKFGFSIEWGERSFSSDSPYLRLSEGFKKILEKMRTRPNPATAESLASKVFAIAGRRSAPFRLRVGRDARFTYALKRVIPSKIVQRMYGKLTDRILSRDISV